ncbi:Sgf29 protein [Saccharomycopsis crataegensis]|uniref:Sgf29 protein n=1 Tax=Saccharomycopsis crataegensis TaxID=43959 RepID=A0AAV5QQS9_9ASCO|nr:Sgf29 protein [Saccharomycopsis crataegensis]
MNGEWDIVISSLQDICQANQSKSLDSITDQVKKQASRSQNTEDELRNLSETINNHKENVDKALRLLNPVLDNLNQLIKLKQGSGSGGATSASPPTTHHDAAADMAGSGSISMAADSGKNAPSVKKRRVVDAVKKGKSYYSSPYNPSDPVVLRSEVAFRLKGSSLGEEWIQCEVTKIYDPTKFDVTDPEPDENNNPGKTYRAGWKEILLIPTENDAKELIAYQFGTKVIARYPETTTFYPAEVIGTKRDGRCRLRFDGEEEVGKETEVDRRLVLPYPDPKSHN